MPHRKRIRHFHEFGHLHELTFSCFARRALLTDDWRMATLANCIETAGMECDMRLAAFVFMPEHVHLLVYPTVATYSVSRYLARVKQPCSKRIKQELALRNSPLLERLTTKERPGKSCFRFWQEGPGFDRNLYTPRAIEASINYIHQNPVKRGLCGHAIEWKWSSASFYLDNAKARTIELPTVHGLPAGTLD